MTDRRDCMLRPPPEQARPPDAPPPQLHAGRAAPATEKSTMGRPSQKLGHRWKRPIR